MVGFNMDGPTRDQVLKFMEEKDRIEEEIEELTLLLETNQNVGMYEPLVDPDGFPRNDIDVYRVRHARHRILCLQNDHKELMKKIEEGLHAVHSEFMGPHGEGTSRSRPHVPMEVGGSGSATNGNGHIMLNGYHNADVESRVAGVVEATNNLRVTDRAFVKITSVSAGSPADSAGIRNEDEVLQFGSVNGSNYNNLSQIVDVVQHSVGARVNLRLRRGTEVLNVTLVPSSWAGAGLLGCMITPI